MASDTLQIVLVVVVAVAVLLWLSAVTPPFKSYWEGFFGEFGTAHAKALRDRRKSKRLRPAEGGELAAGCEVVQALLPPPLTGLSYRAISVGNGPSVAGMDSALAAEAQHVQFHDVNQLLFDLRAAVERSTAEPASETLLVDLRVPLTGSWVEETKLDLGRVFAVLFGIDRPIVVSYEEPIDASAWPSRVFLEVVGELSGITTRLADAGVNISRDVAVLGNALQLEASLAARVLPGLFSPQPEDRAPLLAGEERPQYASYLALAVRDSGGLTRDRRIATELQADLDRAGARLVALAGTDVEGSLPLTPYRGRVTAWRGVFPDAAPQSGRPESGDNSVNRQIDALERAVEAAQLDVAVALLTDGGRSWIETTSADRAVMVMARSSETFGRGTAAGQWARYLTALDAALRLQDPRDEWFASLRGAERPQGPLGLLFDAERMEFARLRREIPLATALLSELAPQVEGPVIGGTAADIYALATARFLVGNMLRYGGRYDLARAYIGEAAAALDSEVAAHAVEALHCRYAMAVCDAIDGVPRVEILDVPEGQLVFASSLVTLSNAQAAWFVNDLERASEFARRAEAGFARIGYTRYALRSRSVGDAFKMWRAIKQRGTPDFASSPIGRIVELTLRRGSEPIDLSRIRASTALSVLQFALSFAASPDAERRVRLPALLALAQSGDIILRRAREADSLASADRVLRQSMGIGKGRTVPMIPD